MRYAKNTAQKTSPHIINIGNFGPRIDTSNTGHSQTMDATQTDNSSFKKI